MNAGPVFAACILAASLPGAAVAQTPAELHALFAANDVFALRDAVAGMPSPPLFYRGAVEAMENRVSPAQRDLHSVVQAAPHSDDAYQAHDLLGNLYFRNGMYREAMRELNAAHAERLDAADVNNALPLFRRLSVTPDMRVVRRSSSKFLRVGEDHGGLPVLINGKPVTYGFDTGATLSFMGEADAKALGLVVKRVESKLSESSGSDVAGFTLRW
jgi:hypothetical protein